MPDHSRRTPLAATLLALVAGLAVGGAPSSPARADEGAAFPEVSGTNLDGRAYTLPGDLDGDLNLVLLAFKRNQQADIDSWIPLADELEAAHARFRAYEVPALPSRIRFMRSVIDGGMRKGIDDPVAWARTITVYTDCDALRDALAIPDEESIHAVLIDRQGAVVWRAEGRPADSTAAELGKLLAARIP